jgi:hypothetical protein
MQHAPISLARFVPIAEMAVCELPPSDRTLAVAYTEHLGHR